MSRFEFLDEQIGVDFVVNRGGDVSTYRVCGTDGNYRLYAK